MTGRRDLLRLWIVGLAITLLAAPSCDDESTKPDPPGPEDPYRPDTSIANVLANVHDALEAADSTGYATRLAPEFTLLLCRGYCGGGDPMPESWGRAEELAAVGKMLGGQPNHDGFALERFFIDFDVDSCRASPDVPGATRVRITAVNIAADSRRNGEQLRYVTNGDQAQIDLVPVEETYGSTGRPLWRILRWKDEPIGNKASEDTPWSRMKWLWS